jgi:hypothetical protein
MSALQEEGTDAKAPVSSFPAEQNVHLFRDKAPVFRSLQPVTRVLPPINSSDPPDPVPEREVTRVSHVSRCACAALFVAILCFCGCSRHQYVVSSPAIRVKLSANGQIISVDLGPARETRHVVAETDIQGCTIEGRVEATELENGGARFQKHLTCGKGEVHKLALVEEFLPTGDSIRWQIELRGNDSPWSTAIETRLKWPDVRRAQFWTTWGDDSPESAGANAGLIISERNPTQETWVDFLEHRWRDPLVPRPFRNLELWYGGHPYLEGGFSIPIATVVESDHDTGMSLALSPRDTTIDLGLETTSDGSITFSRLYNRLGSGAPVRFSMDLIGHQADWRPALGWMAKTYHDYFYPQGSEVEKMYGLGAYSGYQGRLDQEALKKMAFKVNWNAHFDWPYIGMFLPPVKKDVSWTSYKNEQTSITMMNNYCESMEKMGFHVLSYFNVTDIGSNRDWHTHPARTVSNAPDLWKSAENFLYGSLADAILLSFDGKVVKSWDGAIQMDPGALNWETFLLDQAKSIRDNLPACSGIAIDEMYDLARFNPRADDGVTWLPGYGARRALTMSWKDFMAKLAPIMHQQQDKPIFGNTLLKRLDLADHLDGIFSEHGDQGNDMNLDAFLALQKPAIEWVTDPNRFRPDPDAFLQRFLYMGVFPMAPYPENDHSLRPDPEIDKYYLDYGPLFQALDQRKWVFAPHAIDVKGAVAKADVFETPLGYAIPVTFGGQASNATITLRNLAHLEHSVYEFMNPGGQQWARLTPSFSNNGVDMEVPLKRGCALVRIQ